MNKEFDFIKNRKVCAIIAACVLLFGLVFNIIFGVKLDTNFKGGTIYTYSFNGEMDEDGVKAMLPTFSKPTHPLLSARS